MSAPPIYLGETQLRPADAEVRGEFVNVGSDRYYRITAYDRMPPFFMSIVSASDHWMFVSSKGGLTAGRRDSDNALFPYYPEDRIHDDADHTGARTVLRVRRDEKRFLWEPFSDRSSGAYEVSRAIYKNVLGNRLMFEEVNRDLDLVFRYTWATSDRFGFVKTAGLENTGEQPARVEVLDGVENILPWGVQASFQSRFSVLGDAYKQNELDRESGLATFGFSSLPGDGAEPAEALRATVCWASCSVDAMRLISSEQVDAFRSGQELQWETRMCGRRGSYFVHEVVELPPAGHRDWMIVADLAYGQVEMTGLRKLLTGPDDVSRVVLCDLEESSRRLAAIVAGADGLQTTGDTLGSAHHFANVLFNVMRGGVFESGYEVEVADLEDFLGTYNRAALSRHADLLGGLGEQVHLDDLVREVEAAGDPTLTRLVSEYLPISFSRRHGDPSRPWNHFSINVRERDGSRVLDYQGNWRDIFQNWEALSLSFPEYLRGMISKFLNTTTADGYNPYRVMRDGFEWEEPEPGSPWANLGYWGDHQLVYLLKLLEWSSAHHPGDLPDLLAERRFVYAEVPYDIRPYRDLLADPRNSIHYSGRREALIRSRIASLGSDGAYLPDPAGELLRANLAEKLFVPLLAKLGNFAPGAGFWMSTQRPEWNDANNALAGFGASVVTLCYARRYVSFLLDLLAEAPPTVEMHVEVIEWLERSDAVLSAHRSLLGEEDISDQDRKSVLDGLGGAAGDYRGRLYEHGLRGTLAPVETARLRSFLDLTLEFLDQTIRLNRREDGLYHAYNVLEIRPESIGIVRLDAMLEGQVAALSSGALGPREARTVMEALRHSEMYRSDQHSYLLYPARELAGFAEKNVIPHANAQDSELFRRLVADGNTDLVEQDVEGRLHFNASFHNVRDVRAALETLTDLGYADLVARERDHVAEIFESVFQHRRFTGRSGTFYGYEGLGCIYWHMVSKLLLAVQESAVAARAEGEDESFGGLVDWYYDVRSGLGFNKTPDVYGAFPTDPYSHTPGHSGARQPGMTGQVKEEIITRLGELGLWVRNGCVAFDPLLLRRCEFLEREETFEFFDLAGEVQTIALEPGALAFTYCQVPVVYQRSDENRITLRLADGTVEQRSGLALDPAISAELFRRSGRIVRIDVFLSPGLDL
jgi:hypothetical protein